MKNVTWREHKKELLKDPALRAEIEKLGPEYTIARQIIELRMKKKLTQQDLAKKAHTSQVVISRLENGQANPSVRLLKRVFNALDKDLDVVAR